MTLPCFFNNKLDAHICIRSCAFVLCIIDSIQIMCYSIDSKNLHM